MKASFTYGPLAWVLVLTGFVPLGRRVLRTQYRKHSKSSILYIVRKIMWFNVHIAQAYLTILFVSYPINHEDDLRLDKKFTKILRK